MLALSAWLALLHARWAGSLLGGHHGMGRFVCRTALLRAALFVFEARRVWHQRWGPPQPFAQDDGTDLYRQSARCSAACGQLEQQKSQKRWLSELPQSHAYSMRCSNVVGNAWLAV